MTLINDSEWKDITENEQWIKFTIKTSYSTEEYITRCNDSICDSFGLQHNPGILGSNVNYGDNLTDKLYYSMKAEEFLTETCFCDAYEITHIELLTKQELKVLQDIAKNHKADADYSTYELSNDFCYHSKGELTVNEQIMNFAKRRNSR